MPRRRKRQRKREEEHTHLAIRVERYEARVEASVNHHVFAPEYAWNLDDEDPVYEFTSHLTIEGTSTYPEERAGDGYELTIYGDDAPSRRLNLRLKDVQARDKHGVRQYRLYRGREIPVFDHPSGLGLLNKIRGERRWTAWAHVAPHFVNDALSLLGCEKNLFLAINERKKDRTRWLQSVGLLSCTSMLVGLGSLSVST